MVTNRNSFHSCSLPILHFFFHCSLWPFLLPRFLSCFLFDSSLGLFYLFPEYSSSHDASIIHRSLPRSPVPVPLPRCFSFPPRLVHPVFTSPLTCVCLTPLRRCCPLPLAVALHVARAPRFTCNVFSSYHYAGVFNWNCFCLPRKPDASAYISYFSFYPKKRTKRKEKKFREKVE